MFIKELNVDAVADAVVDVDTDADDVETEVEADEPEEPEKTKVEGFFRESASRVEEPEKNYGVEEDEVEKQVEK